MGDPGLKWPTSELLTTQGSDDEERVSEDMFDSYFSLSSESLSAQSMLTYRYGNWNAKTVMALMEVGLPPAMLGL